ncbi:MAG: DUF4912 domain-containing protein [Prochlorotrichaceae cyanobacterium]
MPTATRTVSLEEMTLRQLRRIASSYRVSRYSRMRKSQLVEAIESIEEQQQGVDIAPRRFEAQEEVGAAKFNLGQASTSEDNLVLLDESLEDLPDGYGESRIVMMPRDPQWAYVYWDLPNDAREAMRRQGGEILTLRLYDVTGLEEGSLPELSIQEHSCDELAREWYLSLPISDRDYQAEIGYRSQGGAWFPLAQSGRVHVPPIYPSEWVEDYFVKVSWEEELVDRSPIHSLQIPVDMPQRIMEHWVFHAAAEYPSGSGHQFLSSHAVGSGHMNGNGHQQFFNPTLQALPLTSLFQSRDLEPVAYAQDAEASLSPEEQATWKFSYSH